MKQQLLEEVIELYKQNEETYKQVIGHLLNIVERQAHSQEVLDQCARIRKNLK